MDGYKMRISKKKNVKFLKQLKISKVGVEFQSFDLQISESNASSLNLLLFINVKLNLCI